MHDRMAQGPDGFDFHFHDLVLAGTPSEGAAPEATAGRD